MVCYYILSFFCIVVDLLLISTNFYNRLYGLCSDKKWDPGA